MSTSPGILRDTRVLEIVIGGAGLACMAWCAGSLLSAALYQDQAARALSLLRAERSPVVVGRDPAFPTSDVRGAMATGVVGRLEIPAARISVMIREGADDATLQRAVGHVPGSALPGEAGQVILAGHRDTFLRGLSRLRPGDAIRVVSPDGEFRYRVESTHIVPPSSTSVLRRGTRSGLTLITCYPFQFVGPAPLRYIVRARSS